MATATITDAKHPGPRARDRRSRYALDIAGAADFKDARAAAWAAVLVDPSRAVVSRTECWRVGATDYKVKVWVGIIPPPVCLCGRGAWDDAAGRAVDHGGCRA